MASIATATATAITVQDILLSSEERFDIWNVKKEERPYLLSNDDMDLEEDDSVLSSSSSSENDDSEVLPLLDGCDIPGWRKEQLVSVSSYTRGLLNVGSGCSLLRRESQLPTAMSSTYCLHKWKQLQQQLLIPPPNTAIRLAPDETIKLIQPYPWFERDNVPAILEGCTRDWAAMQLCTWENLLNQFGDYDWRFSDTHGACMTLKTYTKYVKSIEGLADDAPLAVYDSQLHLDDRASIFSTYQVPPCFAGFDLFQDVMDHSNQNGNDFDDDEESGANPPPYRWILMGPARSGTGLHIDPMGTHAWVTVVEGCKRWVLFPPSTDLAAIGMQDPQIPSSIWFSKWYPKVMPEHPNAVEVLQYPGETVYVPAGWPHLVLNLEDTVAITQNYATEYPNVHQLVDSVQKSEPEFFQEWLPKIKQSRQDLFQDHYVVQNTLTELQRDSVLQEDEKKE